jgi:hypothetical protein
MSSRACVIHAAGASEEIASAAQQLRQSVERRGMPPRQAVLEIFERWSGALSDGELRELPGLPFLQLWLRRGNLEPLLLRELGRDALDGQRAQEGSSWVRAYPLGVVGHWPAGNFEIQPILSLTCGLLGGNGCLVRVPSRLVEVTRSLMARLQGADPDGLLTGRICMVSFDRSRQDLHEAVAQAVDGAMIWGGAEAVSQLRRLPFPHWARVMVFGPRTSAAAMDAPTWGDPTERKSWCRRIAREVWQFDQQACSSPHALFLERGQRCDPGEFVADLKTAFAEENRAHPRRAIEPSLTSAVCLARAAWLLQGNGNSAFFPASPDWTILLGSGTDLPTPTQGRTLRVLVVDELLDVVSKFDATVQTLGLGICDPQKEEAIASLAGQRGVDRIVKLGRMHVFGSPWDGMELVRPMVRLVRHVQSQD